METGNGLILKLLRNSIAGVLRSSVQHSMQKINIRGTQSLLYICFVHKGSPMNQTTAALTALFNRIPRRHTLENVKDINAIIAEYENLLKNIEAVNAYYEKNTPVFFDELDSVRSAIKKSTDNKISKKNKDGFFDEASGMLKESMQTLLEVYADGNKE